jgi:glyoxylase-like metal-dependent hydrolase (beta-lactamase superfamily II)
MRMRRLLEASILAGAAAALGAARPDAEFPSERAYRIEDLGPGIFAFVNPETSGPIPSGNVTAVVGDDGVLVVDSGRFPTLARRMIADIRKRTDKPVRYVVHTHWHLDHVVGDGEFAAAYPQALFVSTDFTCRKMLEKQVSYLRDVEKNGQGYVEQIQARLAKGTRDDGTPIPEDSKKYLANMASDVKLEMAELSGEKVVPPALTFDRSLTLHLGRREVRLLFLGEGNTAGDTVVYVPDARVVAAGDLLVAPTPYGYGCHPADWVQTLQKLTTLDAAAIVPGHGPVMRDWEYAKKVRDVLEAIRGQVGQAVASGATLEETQKRVNVETFQKSFAGDSYARNRAFRDYFLADAVTRAWQEAKGKVEEE